MDEPDVAQRNTRDQLLRIGSYYNAAAGERAVEGFLKGAQSGVDDLDNALYYLLNQFTSAEIRQRLKLAAEVHPEEIARRVFGPHLEDEDDKEGPTGLPETQKPPESRSKMDDLWEKAMRQVKD